jgi:chemotaxis signal transduction protein
VNPAVSQAEANTPNAQAADTQGERAQVITCGGVQVAVPYSWARSVVEQFDLAPVPNAPVWLAGAANVEGRCIAVIDLGLWLEPETPELLPPEATARRSRLLLGGEGDDAFALRFQGLPGLVRSQPAGTAARISGISSSAAERLTPYLQGSAGDAQLPLLDLPALAQQWAAEMAL